MGGPVRDVVLVIPRGVTTRQRQAMVDAAAVAGLRLLAFMHPTTAAALQLGLQNRGLGDEPQHVLIYDMGASKTEAGVYRFDPLPPSQPATSLSTSKRNANSFGTITLVGSIATDMGLGGRSIDACLAAHIENVYMATSPTSGKHRVLAGATLQDRKAVMSLMRAANKAKEMLSANREAPVTVEGIAPDTDFSLKISRATLEGQCESLWARAVSVRDAALKSANISLVDLSRFEVVGGGLRVPIVLDRLSEGYSNAKRIESVGAAAAATGGGTGGPSVDRTLNSDEAMVIGAGYFGAALSGHFRIKGFRLVERLGFNVHAVVNNDSSDVAPGVNDEGRKKLLFPASTKLPARMRIRLNSTNNDFDLQLIESTGTPASSTTTTTTVSGVLEALKQVGFGDADAHERNISHLIWVDVRASEGGMVYVEKAEIQVTYFVNASRKVKRLVNKTTTLAEGGDGDATASAAESVERTEDAQNEQSSLAEDEIVSDEAASRSESGGDDDVDERTRQASQVKQPASPNSDPGTGTADQTKNVRPTTTYETVTEVRREARTRTFPLTLLTRFSPPATPMSAEESIISRDLLRHWRRRDALQLRRSSARNDLEAYLLWALSDGFLYNDAALKAVGSQAEMDKAADRLRESQDWLEGVGSNSETSVDELREKLRQAKLLVRTALREKSVEEERDLSSARDGQQDRVDATAATGAEGEDDYDDDDEAQQDEL